MRDLEKVLSAPGGAFCSDDLPARFRRDLRTTDLSSAIKLTRDKIDKAFNQDLKFRGKVRAKD